MANNSANTNNLLSPNAAIDQGQQHQTHPQQQQQQQQHNQRRKSTLTANGFFIDYSCTRRRSSAAVQANQQQQAFARNNFLRTYVSPVRWPRGESFCAGQPNTTHTMMAGSGAAATAASGGQMSHPSSPSRAQSRLSRASYSAAHLPYSTPHQLIPSIHAPSALAGSRKTSIFDPTGHSIAPQIIARRKSTMMAASNCPAPIMLAPTVVEPITMLSVAKSAAKNGRPKRKGELEQHVPVIGCSPTSIRASLAALEETRRYEKLLKRLQRHQKRKEKRRKVEAARCLARADGGGGEHYDDDELGVAAPEEWTRDKTGQWQQQQQSAGLRRKSLRALRDVASLLNRGSGGGGSGDGGGYSQRHNRYDTTEGLSVSSLSFASSRSSLPSLDRYEINNDELFVDENTMVNFNDPLNTGDNTTNTAGLTTGRHQPLSSSTSNRRGGSENGGKKSLVRSAMRKLAHTMSSRGLPTATQQQDRPKANRSVSVAGGMNYWYYYYYLRENSIDAIDDLPINATGAVSESERRARLHINYSLARIEILNSSTDPVAQLANKMARVAEHNNNNNNNNNTMIGGGADCSANSPISSFFDFSQSTDVSLTLSTSSTITTTSGASTSRNSSVGCSSPVCSIDNYEQEEGEGEHININNNNNNNSSASSGAAAASSTTTGSSSCSSSRSSVTGIGAGADHRAHNNTSHFGSTSMLAGKTASSRQERQQQHLQHRIAMHSNESIERSSKTKTTTTTMPVTTKQQQQHYRLPEHSISSLSMRARPTSRRGSRSADDECTSVDIDPGRFSPHTTSAQQQQAMLARKWSLRQHSSRPQSFRRYTAHSTAPFEASIGGPPAQSWRKQQQQLEVDEFTRQQQLTVAGGVNNGGVQATTDRHHHHQNQQLGILGTHSHHSHLHHSISQSIRRSHNNLAIDLHNEQSAPMNDSKRRSASFVNSVSDNNNNNNNNNDNEEELDDFERLNRCHRGYKPLQASPSQQQSQQSQLTQPSQQTTATSDIQSSGGVNTELSAAVGSSLVLASATSKTIKGRNSNLRLSCKSTRGSAHHESRQSGSRTSLSCLDMLTGASGVGGSKGPSKSASINLAGCGPDPAWSSSTANSGRASPLSICSTVTVTGGGGAQQQQQTSTSNTNKTGHDRRFSSSRPHSRPYSASMRLSAPNYQPTSGSCVSQAASFGRQTASKSLSRDDNDRGDNHIVELTQLSGGHSNLGGLVCSKSAKSSKFEQQNLSSANNDNAADGQDYYHYCDFHWHLQQDEARAIGIGRRQVEEQNGGRCKTTTTSSSFYSANVTPGQTRGRARSHTNIVNLGAGDSNEGETVRKLSGAYNWDRFDRQWPASSRYASQVSSGSGGRNTRRCTSVSLKVPKWRRNCRGGTNDIIKGGDGKQFECPACANLRKQRQQQDNWEYVRKEMNTTTTTVAANKTTMRNEATRQIRSNDPAARESATAQVELRARAHSTGTGSGCTQARCMAVSYAYEERCEKGSGFQEKVAGGGGVEVGVGVALPSQLLSGVTRGVHRLESGSGGSPRGGQKIGGTKQQQTSPKRQQQQEEILSNENQIVSLSQQQPTAASATDQHGHGNDDQRQVINLLGKKSFTCLLVGARQSGKRTIVKCFVKLLNEFKIAADELKKEKMLTKLMDCSERLQGLTNQQEELDELDRRMSMAQGNQIGQRSRLNSWLGSGTVNRLLNLPAAVVNKRRLNSVSVTMGSSAAVSNINVSDQSGGLQRRHTAIDPSYQLNRGSIQHNAAPLDNGSREGLHSDANRLTVRDSRLAHFNKSDSNINYHRGSNGNNNQCEYIAMHQLQVPDDSGGCRRRRIPSTSGSRQDQGGGGGTAVVVAGESGNISRSGSFRRSTQLLSPTNVVADDRPSCPDPILSSPMPRSRNQSVVQINPRRRIPLSLKELNKRRFQINFKTRRQLSERLLDQLAGDFTADNRSIASQNNADQHQQSSKRNNDARSPPDAFMVVYAVNDRESFEFAKHLVNQLRSIKQEIGPLPIVLVANKIDLERAKVVKSEEGRTLARKNGCKFMEISCTVGFNLDNLLVGLRTQLVLKHHIVLNTVIRQGNMKSIASKEKKQQPQTGRAKGSDNILVRFYKRYVMDNYGQNYDCDNFSKL